MLTALDHIIIGVSNLEQAARIFSEKLGLTASGGGNHPEGGTANRIIVIGDTYIELIAVRNPAEAQESMVGRLAQGDGYLNFVLASDDIRADSAAIQRRGVSIIGPREGKLTGTDGRTRGWMRTDIERPDLTQHYPFLIQHDSTGEERRSSLAGGKTPPEHPLGATKVLSATLVVEDLGEAIERFQRIYGIQASEQYSGEVDSWDAILVSFLLHESLQSFELAIPIPVILDPPDGGEHLPEPGALTRYLQRCGESLCRITLAVDSLENARNYLDAHGVVYTYREEPRPVVWISPDDACGAAIVLHEFTPEIPPSFPLVPGDTTI
ncbi:MAG: VOC family protein [Ktedonobacteraceae bacterium]|nr:VOC family protein [Ktedonobacteraceae bacterium]